MCIYIYIYICIYIQVSSGYLVESLLPLGRARLLLQLVKYAHF